MASNGNPNISPEIFTEIFIIFSKSTLNACCCSKDNPHLLLISKTQDSTACFLTDAVIVKCSYEIDSVYSDKRKEYNINGQHVFAKACQHNEAN
jgi:hypothetical protein